VFDGAVLEAVGGTGEKVKMEGVVFDIFYNNIINIYYKSITFMS